VNATPSLLNRPRLFVGFGFSKHLCEKLESPRKLPLSPSPALGLTVDRDGNVVVAVSTLAGGRQDDDDENDDENDVEVFADGQGQNARVKFPTSVVVAANGDIFVSDFYLSAIRVVTPQGAVRTLCGNGQAGFADAQGADARFNFPCGLAAGGGKRGFADRTAHSVSRWTRRRTCWWQISVNTRLGA
jgi:hypothetical protein